MRLDSTLELPVPVSDAARMYADPGYAELRGEALNAESASATIVGTVEEGFTVTTTLRLPTDKVPDLVRPFVGSAVTINEVQTWEAPREDGSRSGRIDLKIEGAPGRMTGTSQMRAAGAEASVVTIDGDLKADVPLVGRRIEKAALPYVGSVLRREERAALAWARRDRGDG